MKIYIPYYENYGNANVYKLDVEYVESIGYNARQASDYAVEYVSKLPFVSYITVISIERK